MAVLAFCAAIVREASDFRSMPPITSVACSRWRRIRAQGLREQKPVILSDIPASRRATCQKFFTNSDADDKTKELIGRLKAGRA